MRAIVFSVRHRSPPVAAAALCRYLKRWISGGTLVINVPRMRRERDFGDIANATRYTRLFIFLYSLHNIHIRTLYFSLTAPLETFHLMNSSGSRRTPICRQNLIWARAHERIFTGSMKKKHAFCFIHKFFASKKILFESRFLKIFKIIAKKNYKR